MYWANTYFQGSFRAHYWSFSFGVSVIVVKSVVLHIGSKSTIDFERHIVKTTAYDSHNFNPHSNPCITHEWWRFPRIAFLVKARVKLDPTVPGKCPNTKTDLVNPLSVLFQL